MGGDGASVMVAYGTKLNLQSVRQALLWYKLAGNSLSSEDSHDKVNKVNQERETKHWDDNNNEEDPEFGLGPAMHDQITQFTDIINKLIITETLHVTQLNYYGADSGVLIYFTPTVDFNCYSGSYQVHFLPPQDSAERISVMDLILNHIKCCLGEAPTPNNYMVVAEGFEDE